MNGLPAAVVQFELPPGCISHIHGGDDRYNEIIVTVPYAEHFLADVGGKTILIRIESRYASNFEIWRPLAEEIVQSIHFRE